MTTFDFVFLLGEKDHGIGLGEGGDRNVISWQSGRVWERHTVYGRAMRQRTYGGYASGKCFGG